MLAGKRLAVVLVTPAGSNLGKCMFVTVWFFHAAKSLSLQIVTTPPLGKPPSNRPADETLCLASFDSRRQNIDPRNETET
jgi:hypothetical protein